MEPTSPNPTPHKSNPNARTKALVAVALSLVFVVVVGYQMRDLWSDATCELAAASPAPAAIQATTPPNSPSQPSQAKEPLTAALEFDLESVLLQNPFRNDQMREWGEETVPLASAPRGGRVPQAEYSLEDLTEEEGLAQFQAIAHGKSRAVLINGQLVGEQDVINDRWRIVSIRPDSIVVEPAQ